jgi:hypothetical protein
MRLGSLSQLNPAQLAFDLPDWWREIDASPAWQRGAFDGLAVAYGALAIVALVQIIRIQLRVPEYGWTTQKVFHLLNFLVCGLRSGVFAFRYQVQELPYAVVQAGLLDLPGEELNAVGRSGWWTLWGVGCWGSSEGKLGCSVVRGGPVLLCIGAHPAYTLLPAPHVR